MQEMLFPGLQVVERGWLSANMVITHGPQTAVIDTGYASHQAQTVALVRAALGDADPHLLINTHLHSDHCGGNAALYQAFAGLQRLIPPGQAAAVQAWDTDALSYRPTGQFCPRYGYDDLLAPGQALLLGERHWQVLAAPGHDPHSVVLFEPDSRTLISADALWENGFGVVFPELEGVQAFEEVAKTLDLIEGLQPKTVIPGHGAVFLYRHEVLARARQRLAAFMQDPLRHAQHAAKVLIKVRLLEKQQEALAPFMEWAGEATYLQTLHREHFGPRSIEDWITDLLMDLQRSGAARIQEGLVFNQG